MEAEVHGGSSDTYIPPAGGGSGFDPNKLQPEFSNDPVLKDGLWGLATKGEKGFKRSY